MKKYFTIAIMFLSLTVFGKGGGGGHAGGGHASEGSHSEGHISESESNEHSFNGVHESEENTIPRSSIKESDIHYNSNRALYYYVLFNHKTNTTDTVYAKTKDDLKDIVSKDEKHEATVIVNVIACFFLVIWLIALIKSF